MFSKIYHKGYVGGSYGVWVLLLPFSFFQRKRFCHSYSFGYEKQGDITRSTNMVPKCTNQMTD